MRFDTHRVSAFLVESLQRARPSVEVIVDDGDIIHARTRHGDLAAIYLIETAISAAEIRYHVDVNSADRIHTLFVLWGDLLIPADGARYQPHDWMQALLTLHGDKIYAFDPYLGDDLVFPAHFEREPGSYTRRIRYGAPIRAGWLSCSLVTADLGGRAGTWRVADFEPRAPAASAAPSDPLHAHFALLGIERRATTHETRAAVKHAYRRLARQHHPDLSDHPAAAERMRQLNEAYSAILDTLDSAR